MLSSSDRCTTTSVYWGSFVAMPSTLECVLMRKCSIKKNEARKLVTLGQESLGTQDVEWSAQLEKECIRIHKEKLDRESEDRYSGLSPYLAFKVKEHEKNFNTVVEIKPLGGTKKKEKTGKTVKAPSDPHPTFQESATTKSLPPRGRKKVTARQKQNLETKGAKSKTETVAPNEKVSAPARIRSPSPVQSKTTKAENNVGAAKPPSVPSRSPSPLLDKGSQHSQGSATPTKPSTPQPQSPQPHSNSSVVSESSTSEMSSLSAGSDRMTTIRSATPPPRPWSPPTEESPPRSDNAALTTPRSPDISYAVPGATASTIDSPTKRLAKLATMSIVSPMVRTKKMAIARNSEFSAFEAPLTVPTHGRRRRRRASQRNRRRSTNSGGGSLSNSLHSKGESSISSVGSDSIQSSKACSDDESFSNEKKKRTAIGEFLRQLLGKKIVALTIDNCPGPGPDNGDESDYETPSLLGISDCEYESDAMYESDTLEDYDFFDDNGSVGSNNGAMYVDPGNAMLPMPKLESVMPRHSRSHNPYDSNDEESFSDDSDEAPRRPAFGRSNSFDSPMCRSKGRKLPVRASSFDGYTEASTMGARKGRRMHGGRQDPERDVPQRAASFDLDDLSGKGRKRDAV